MSQDVAKSKVPHVVIIGGGFGGLEVAKSLANCNVRVTLIDRRNYHLFQPMLYQVATAALSPADIACPIRQVLSRIKNCNVVLAEVAGIDLQNQQVQFTHNAIPYDYLVLAAGASHSYFGNDHWAQYAPGLKTLENATEIRRRLLLAFESAEYEGDPEERRAALTFAIVGGGPTGVELAGSIKEIATTSLARDFRNIDTKTARVILIESADRVLMQFDPTLSERAKRDLERMGVEVMLHSKVTEITEQGVTIGEQFVPVRNVIWAAGVAASSLGKSLGVPLDRAGRVIVEPDLSVPQHSNVFVIGDMAAAKSADTNKPVPGVAQGALQMGSHVAKLIRAEARAQGAVTPRPAFKYHDKGSMATIGKALAVAEIGKWKFGGYFAWLLWGAIHIFFLVGFRNRLAVFSKWTWNWIVNARDSRLIMGDAHLTIDKIAGEDIVPLSKSKE
ncbi:MAG: NAD(P)/FAD-dependent oxidoreductase [Planctomycetaceae bacterium]|nr:NAD(P)/FAD-dependent oxidoreductase [Planctomycetaceae bacterium]